MSEDIFIVFFKEKYYLQSLKVPFFFQETFSVTQSLTRSPEKTFTLQHVCTDGKKLSKLERLSLKSKQKKNTSLAPQGFHRGTVLFYCSWV